MPKIFYWKLMLKLTMYNSTGICQQKLSLLCAMGPFSAFRKIIDRVLDDNYFTELIATSESCVSQNRNSHISFCVLDVLRYQPDLVRLTMKYSMAAHGA